MRLFHLVFAFLFFTGRAHAVLTPIGGNGNATSIQGVPISASAPSGTECLVYSGGTWAPASCSAGSGTVTSVGASVPSWLAVTGPVTTSGTLAITAATGQTTHRFIGTGTGTSFAPIAIAAGDLPDLSATYLALIGGTMSGAIAMGSNKITGLTNGSSSADAVAFNQLSAYAPLASPTFTGTITTPLTAHGAVISDSSTHLATVAPGTSGNVLTSNGTDWTSAAAAGGGVSTVGAFSGSSQTNGASISSSTITFGPADGTNPGMISESAQTMGAGNKTFGGSVLFSADATYNVGAPGATRPKYQYTSARNFTGVCQQTLVSQTGTALDGFLYAGNLTTANAMMGSAATGDNTIGAFIGWIDSTNGFIGMYDGISDNTLHFGTGGGPSYVWDLVNTGAKPFQPHADGGATLGGTSNRWTSLVSKSVAISGTQTTVNGSVSGNMVCSEPNQGVTYKKVMCYLAALNDAANTAYTYPVAFTNTPFVSGVAAGVSGATASTTTVSFTVAGTTGFVFMEGY